MTRKAFTLVEVLATIGMLALFLNGIVILSTQVLAAHKQHQAAGAQLATEDLLAQRWRQFVGEIDAQSSISVGAKTINGASADARIDADGVWLNGVLTPLPTNLNADFSADEADPAVLVLTLVNEQPAEHLRIVARYTLAGESQ